MNIKNKTLVVCHDAGGAEIISAYLKKNNKRQSFFCLVSGPAVKIFKRKKIPALKFLKKDKKEIEKIISKFNIDFLLTGTSWASSVDIDFIKIAKKRNIKTISFLDHWVNYRERFGYPRKTWKNNLPNEIWVGDKDAMRLARLKFKDIKIKYIPNPYFEEIKSEYKKYKNKKNSAEGILFVSEPISSNINCFGDKHRRKINEKNILEDFLKELEKIHFQNKIIIRLHPSEKKSKYNQLINKYKTTLKIEKSVGKNAFNDLVRAPVVFGMTSMFLMVAVLCGKKVISYLPNKIGIKFVLPKNKIIRIKSLRNFKKILWK
ncbi:MAG: hypothetical protein NT094_03120 [Candidatus Staskawiczbacteria bacterium]|nr:hypothetical protein [Candidatus Staskawiczbacteria bacterium]